MQYLRFLGAAFVVLSSAWVGFASARRLRRAGRELDELRAALEQLLDGFGRFDLAGQLRQLGLAREALTHQAGRLREQTEAKCRSYEILGLCAGAAVLILVV